MYEVHLGSWRRVPEEGNRYLTYRELAASLVPYVREMGFTHIELMPIMEHPFSGSWGYQVIGFFAPTSRFGTPDDFRYFVDECHRHGIGVILDWVPGHFPKDRHGLAEFDGTALYEHADPRKGEHQDWGTLIFNYGRNEVRSFLLSNALFWLEEFHIDGLRVDAVASMLYLDYSRDGRAVDPEPVRRAREPRGGRVPAAAQHADARPRRRARSRSRRNRPRGRRSAVRCTSAGSASATSGTWAGCTTCSSTSSEDPVHRRWHHGQITFSMLYAFTENFVLPFSHDEVVHGKGSMLDEDAGRRLAEARDAARALRLHVRPSRQEADVHGRASSASGASGTTTRASTGTCCERPRCTQALRRWVQDLNHTYQRERVAARGRLRRLRVPAGSTASDNENSVVSMIRRARDPQDFTVMVVELHAGAAARLPHRRARRRLVPRAAQQRRRRATAAATWATAAASTPSRSPTHGFDQSISLTVPPLGFLLLKK